MCASIVYRIVLESPCPGHNPKQKGTATRVRYLASAEKKPNRLWLLQNLKTLAWFGFCETKHSSRNFGIFWFVRNRDIGLWVVIFKEWSARPVSRYAERDLSCIVIVPNRVYKGHRSSLIIKVCAHYTLLGHQLKELSARTTNPLCRTRP